MGYSLIGANAMHRSFTKTVMALWVAVVLMGLGWSSGTLAAESKAATRRADAGRKSAATRPSQAATRPATTTTSAPAKKPAATSRPTTASTQADAKRLRIAQMRLAGEVSDSPPETSLFGDGPNFMTLSDWLQRLAKARNDSSIQAVALEIDHPEMTWAQAQELADAVARLAASKPVYAYLVSGSAGEFIVASAATQIAMEPSGELEIIGLGAEMVFFRGTLDKLGIRPQMIQIGRFKGAAEPMSTTQPSREVKEIYNSLLDDLFSQYVDQIAHQRKLSPAAVKQAIDTAPLGADQAKELKLVDELVEKADWEEYVEDCLDPDAKKEPQWVERYGRKQAKQIDFSNPLAMLSMMLKVKPSDEPRDPTIAVIHADGVIIDGESGEGLMGERLVGAKTLTHYFRQAAEDDRIRAVIFRINSPGGSAIASELIFQAVRACAEEKPVIVSIADVGASGGYYIALGGDVIYGDPSAIIGSIGVVCGKMAITGLYDKIGVNTYEFTRGRNAGINMSRAWTQREEEVVRTLAQRTYELFVSRVEESRNDKITNIDDVAEGRIFTARQAVANGLIDRVGGLREVIQAAQQAAKVDSCRFVYWPAPKTLIDLLTEDSETRSMSGPHAQLARWQALATGGLLSETGVAGALRTVGRRGPMDAAAGYLLNVAALMDRQATLTAMPYYFSVRR